MSSINNEEICTLYELNVRNYFKKGIQRGRKTVDMYKYFFLNLKYLSFPSVSLQDYLSLYSYSISSG